MQEIAEIDTGNEEESGAGEKEEGRSLSADTGLFPQERRSSEEVVTTAHAHTSLSTDPDPTLLTRS